MLTIEALGTYVPHHRLLLTDLAGDLSLSVDEVNVLQKFYGLKSVAKAYEPVGRLLEFALEDLLQKSSLDPASVGLIIYTHTAYEAEHFPNNLLTRVVRRLGFVNAVHFGIHSNNCASLITALDVAQGYLDNDSVAIVVTADLTFTDIMRHIPHTTVCGDAAAACLISKRQIGTKLLAIETDTFGAHAMGMWQEKADQLAFEELYAPRLAEVMQRSLLRAGLNWSDVRWIFPHNINLLSWRKVAALLGLPMGKLYLHQLPALGHCFGADTILNWAQARESGQLKTGDYLMLATVGLGAVFSAALLKCGVEEQ